MNENKINFFKCRLLSKVIRDIQYFQNTSYDFEGNNKFNLVVKELTLKIKNFKPLQDEKLKELSYKWEPKVEY
jgi:hypothetical protein